MEGAEGRAGRGLASTVWRPGRGLHPGRRGRAQDGAVAGSGAFPRARGDQEGRRPCGGSDPPAGPAPAAGGRGARARPAPIFQRGGPEVPVGGPSWWGLRTQRQTMSGPGAPLEAVRASGQASVCSVRRERWLGSLAPWLGGRGEQKGCCKKAPGVLTSGTLPSRFGRSPGAQWKGLESVGQE